MTRDECVRDLAVAVAVRDVAYSIGQTEDAVAAAVRRFMPALDGYLCPSCGSDVRIEGLESIALAAEVDPACVAPYHARLRRGRAMIRAGVSMANAATVAGVAVPLLRAFLRAVHAARAVHHCPVCRCPAGILVRRPRDGVGDGGEDGPDA